MPCAALRRHTQEERRQARKHHELGYQRTSRNRQNVGRGDGGLESCTAVFWTLAVKRSLRGNLAPKGLRREMRGSAGRCRTPCVLRYCSLEPGRPALLHGASESRNTGPIEFVSKDRSGRRFDQKPRGRWALSGHTASPHRCPGEAPE